jgi:ribosomal protein L22
MADEQEPSDEVEEQAKKPAAKARKPAAKAPASTEKAAAKAEKPAKAKKAAAKTSAQAQGKAKESAAAAASKAKAKAKAKAAQAPAGEQPAAAEKPAAAKPEKPTAAKPQPAASGAPVLRRRSTVRAQARYVRTSARKARMVCVHLRGKSVDEARAILAFTPRDVARNWSKLLESAVANAENNHELLEDDLVVREAYADEGPTIKRFRPRAQGRATPIRKRTSHLTITLTPKP